MAARIRQFIGVFIAVLVLVTSNALHYTHDTGHHHDVSRSDHHPHPEKEGCALCWFLLHQVVHSFDVAVSAPEPIMLAYVPLVGGWYKLWYRDGIARLKQNKDPPR